MNLVTFFLIALWSTFFSSYDRLLVSSFSWEVMPHLHDSLPRSDNELLTSTSASSIIGSKTLGSDLLAGQKVYVSLTTIHNRIYGIASTIESLLKGTVLPNHIYVFVSKDPYLLDQGVTAEFILSESKGKLKEIAKIFPAVSIVFTENLGPHRKLLPLLSKKWNEDCVIVTVDDHEIYPKNAIESLIKYYIASGRNSVVALRARRMGLCSDAPPWRIAPYTKQGKGIWPETSPSREEMLLLPTGTGGVLYRPKFFHPIVFDRQMINISRTGDDLLFRLSTLAMGTRVVTACSVKDALGNPCPSQIQIKYGYGVHSSHLSPSMTSFTFGRNYTDDYAKGLLSPPASGLVVAAAADKTTDKSRKSNAEIRQRERDKRYSSGSGTTSTTTIAGGSSSSVSSSSSSSSRRDKSVALLSSTHGARPRKLVVNDTGTMTYFPADRDDRAAAAVMQSSHRGRNLRTAPVEWRKDPRKKESLATRFNNAGGNNVMLDHLIQHLYDERIVDFDGLLQKFALLERGNCLLSSAIVQPSGVSVTTTAKSKSGQEPLKRSYYGATVDSVKVALQKMYDPECGICTCDLHIPRDRPIESVISNPSTGKDPTDANNGNVDPAAAAAVKATTTGGTSSTASSGGASSAASSSWVSGGGQRVGYTSTTGSSTGKGTGSGSISTRSGAATASSKGYGVSSYAAASDINCSGTNTDGGGPCTTKKAVKANDATGTGTGAAAIHADRDGDSSSSSSSTSSSSSSSSTAATVAVASDTEAEAAAVRGTAYDTLAIATAGTPLVRVSSAVPPVEGVLRIREQPLTDDPKVNITYGDLAYLYVFFLGMVTFFVFAFYVMFKLRRSLIGHLAAH